MSLYDWKNSPEWANYAARDFNGFAQWFESKPELYKEYEDSMCGEWYSSTGRACSSCNPFWDDLADCPPYDQSLEARSEVAE